MLMNFTKKSGFAVRLRPLAGAVLTGALLLGLTACGADEAVEGTAAPVEEETAAAVSVTAVERRDLARTITLGGLLSPQDEVTVMGGGTGSKILNINVAVGDPVRKGQSLMNQDMKDLEIQENTLLLNKSQLEDTYAKSLALYEAGALAESEITSLENQLEQLDLQLETIALNREKMQVTAPISGIVGSLPVVEGQMAAASTMVATIVNIDKLLLDVSVGESYIMGVHQGDELEVLIPAYSAEPVTGRVKTVPPTVNPQTRAYSVTVEIDNPDHSIKGGMYGEIQLTVEKKENTLAIPQKAILEIDGTPSAFIVEDGRAVLRQVETGLTLGDTAEVLSGLAEGEQVVVEGQYTLSDGSLVEIIPLEAEPEVAETALTPEAEGQEPETEGESQGADQ